MSNFLFSRVLLNYYIIPYAKTAEDFSSAALSCVLLIIKLVSVTRQPGHPDKKETLF